MGGVQIDEFYNSSKLFQSYYKMCSLHLYMLPHQIIIIFIKYNATSNLTSNGTSNVTSNLTSNATSNLTFTFIIY